MKEQSGFAALETIIIVVVIAVISGAGYMVWQRHQDNVSKTSNKTSTAPADDIQTFPKAVLGKGCSAGDMRGKMYMTSKALYSICIPNGWKLYSPGDDEIILQGGGTDLTYVKDVEPVVNLNAGGTDGAQEFAVYYSTPASGAPSTFNTVGQFKAGNVTGTEYARTETKGYHGEGTVAKGTIQHIYYFENGAKSIEIDYNLFPGNIDHTEAVAAVAKTLIFN